MHIALLNYVYDAGFATADALLERYLSLTGWAESLLAAGARRVTVLQRFDRDLAFCRDGVAYRLCADRGPRTRPWMYPRRMHRAVAALRPDVAHVNGLHFSLQTVLLRRALPHPSALLVQDHGAAFPTAKNAKDRLFLASLRPLRSLRLKISQLGLSAADGLLFTTAEQARPWREAGLLEPDQPVYEVVEASRPLRPLAREAARASSGVRGDPALLWVGHLDANKDPLTVLDGFERALAELPNARLTMVYATGPLLSHVQARLATSAGLAARVDLRGRVPYESMPAFFSAADIFVLGSHREGSGYALIEAIGCGAAPVVTDIPSFRALTAGGALGALWPPGDAAALAAALLDMAQRDLAAMRAALMAHYERALSWGAIGRRAMEVYQDALARRKISISRNQDTQ